VLIEELERDLAVDNIEQSVVTARIGVRLRLAPLLLLLPDVHIHVSSAEPNFWCLASETIRWMAGD